MSIPTTSNGQYLQRLILLCGLFFAGLYLLSIVAIALAIKIYDLPCDIMGFGPFIKKNPNLAGTINALIFAQVASQIIAMAMPFLVVMQSTYREQMYRVTGFLTIPKTIIVLLVLVLFAAALYPQEYMVYLNGLLFERNPVPDEFLKTMIKADNTDELLINIAFMALLPALCEEMFFRGGVYFFLRRITNKVWMSAIVSSLFFAIIHDQASQIIVYILMGIMLAFVYEFTGSLWMSILLHFANNLFFVLADYYKWGGEIDIESPYSIIMLFFSLLVIAMVFWYLGKKKLAEKTIEE